MPPKLRFEFMRLRLQTGAFSHVREWRAPEIPD
jgi:hypothetical protein